MDIEFVDYDEEFLEYSFTWLNDPEIKKLTMTPDMDKNKQILWYNGLIDRIDYLIWGIKVDGIPIGAVGIKNINYAERIGEYWGYIGDKRYIGKGIGKIMVSFINKKAKEKALDKIYLQVADYNIRAYKLYINQGFAEVRKVDSVIYMEKEI